MTDKICPFKCMKVNGEYYCGDWCALYFKSADMCSLVMIANGTCANINHLRSEEE